MLDYANALNPAQYEAVTSGLEPLLVVAGAGSGKTRTIVWRLAWLAEHGTNPANIALLTFTRKAAWQMLERAGSLLGQGLGGVAGGTFHSFAYGILRRWQPEWLEGRSFTLMDSSDITDALRSCRDSARAGKKDASFPRLATIASIISRARNKEMPIAEALAQEGRHLLPHADDIERMAGAYQDYRRQHALMDYDDLLFELESLLQANTEAVETLRARYTHILVDEYQDTNRVQARIVRLLAGPAQTPENPEPKLGHVMAVGDEAQSIYAFRGATVRNILDFPRLFPAARIVRLEENYRSASPILDVANAILANAPEGFGKRLYTEKKGGDPVRLVTPVSDTTEAALALRRIEELLLTHRPNEIAVLFRAGFHSYALEASLRQMNIPFRKFGGQKFSEAAHIKDILAFGRLAVNPLDMPAFARVGAMHKGIGPKSVQKLILAVRSGNRKQVEKAFARFPAFLADLDLMDKYRALNLSPAVFFDKILDYYRPRMESLYPDDWPRRQQGLEELVHMAHGYESLDVFVADLALNPEQEEGGLPEDCITLSTVHSAKGLEWDAVLILDLVEDRFPSRHALLRPEDYEEERRLLYVAATRARESLDLYAPATVYSRSQFCGSQAVPSPFLREIDSSLTENWLECFDGSLVKRETGGRAAAGARSCGGSATDDGGRALRVQPARPDHPAAPSAPGRVRAQGHCRHRIFGRGKVVKLISEDKAQVNFPGFGLKVILTDYLEPED